VRALRIAAITVAMCTACGSDASAPPPDDTPVDIDQYQSAFIDAICRLAARCGQVDDVATCKSQDVGVNPRFDLVAAVKAGKVIFHGDKARECINATYASGSCEAAQLTFASLQTPACLEVLEGAVPGAGACAFNEECISQRCDRSMCTGDPCCIGKCMGASPPPFAHVGESCERAYCIESFCDPPTTTCHAYIPAGARCSRASTCEPGLACDSGICQTPPGRGQPCHYNNCGQLGTTCSTSSSTCVAVGLLGDPCHDELDCSLIYRCGGDGRCALKPQLGDPCTSGCGDYSFCSPSTSICTAPQPNGASCMASSWCASHWCDDASNTCIDRPICI